MVTVLREPVAQYLSDKTWDINRQFFIHFDESEVCETTPSGSFDCSKVLAQKHEKALYKVRNHLLGRAKSYTSKQCYEYCSWLMGSNPTILNFARMVEERPNLGSDLISALENDYMLVGVTEYIDQFIVLLGLRFHWDLNTMVYHRCKSLHGTSVKLRHLTDSEKSIIEGVIGPSARQAYEWAKRRFEALLAELGQPFKDIVDAFKEAVKNKQAKIQKDIDAGKVSPYRWIPTVYENHYKEYC